MFRPCSFVCLVLLLTTPLCAQFEPRVDYAAGPTPFSVAVGDFNGDGIPDLAVVNSGAGPGNGISILLGNGDGTFKTHVDYPAGGTPHSVAAADFNRDGKLDLAVANGNSNTVSILLGNGDGTFQSPVSYATGQNTQWLVARDFNGDGIPDIATANYGPDYQGGTVSILLGKGDGTFWSQLSFPAGTNPFGIMAADFNHDGKLDLAVVNNNVPFGASILLGNGDGTFQAPILYAAGRNPRIGDVFDFSSNGNLDLAIANCIDNDISILMGDGSGQFASPVDYSVGAYVQMLAGGDFDGDGKRDLVTANSGSNNISFLKGNGDGSFQTHVDFPTGGSPMWVAVADLNHDNAPDLVVANSADNTVSVLLNKGTDFSISATAASPATVSRGQTATSTVTLGLLTLFNNPVTLACSVQPAASAPTCVFSQNPVTFDSKGNATAIVTLDTAATTAAANPGALRFLWLPAMGIALFAGVSFRATPRRKLAACALGVMLTGGLMLQAACAGGTGTAHQPQTYTITITGTSGSAQHSTTTTLVVE